VGDIGFSSSNAPRRAFLEKFICRGAWSSVHLNHGSAMGAGLISSAGGPEAARRYNHMA
jgi:hypothetical protein